MRFLALPIALALTFACTPTDPVGEAVTCAPGEFLDGETCSACAAGTFSASTGATACEPTACAPGEIATKSSAVSATDGCVPCTGGGFSEGGDSLECVRCAAGSFDDDDDPTTACVTCSGCADGEYTAGKCTATTDTTCGTCAEPGAGQFAATACASGSVSELGVDTEILACTAPSATEFVTAACVAGSAQTIGSDTERDDCDAPGEGQYISTACDSGDFETLGSNSTVDDCSAVEAGQFAAEACRPGTPQTRGSDTAIDDCSAPGATGYVTAVCARGSSAEGGSDTEIAVCTEPEATEYVSAACVSGAHDALGTDTAVTRCSGLEAEHYTVTVCRAGSSGEVGNDTAASECSDPEAGQFVTELCVGGDPFTAGSDTALANCTAPADGEFVTAACDSGGFDEMGTDTQIETCSEAGAGEYVVTACVAGSFDGLGVDTEFDACTAIDHCAAGLACTSAQDSTCGSCDRGFELADERTVCTLAADPALLFASTDEPGGVASSNWPAGMSCGTQVVIGAQDVTINRIAAGADLSNDGRLRFVIFDHDDHENPLLLTEAKAFADDGFTWKVSDSLNFTLLAGRTYDISGISDVSATYGFDMVVNSANGIRSTSLNPRLDNFDAPIVDRHFSADCAIQLFGGGLPESPPAGSLILESADGDDRIDNERAAGAGCGTQVTVGDQDVEINWIGAIVDLNEDGAMKFLIFDHDDGDELVYASAPKAFVDDGMTWKVSAPLAFVLRAGRTYDIAGVTNVRAVYPFDAEVESTGGLTTMIRNPNLLDYDAPRLTGHARADCGIQLFTQP
jgi:hypothetical protein